jgi:large subunit ribosomal protein L5
MKDAIRNIEKIVVNTGIGTMSQQSGFNDKLLPLAIKEFSEVVGQKPGARAAKKSIAGYKIREGQIIGLSTTLRGPRMEQFLHRLVSSVMPRIRDFKGIKLTAVDEHGNLNIGIRDHLVFPEISPDHSKISFGLQVAVVPKKSVATRDEAIAIYRSLHVPLQK